ncbi:MAG: hypothetical protein ACRCSF_04985 [Mycobacteriaceae bacterium]
MTDPVHEPTKPISVAELLARNGADASVTTSSGGRRRRKGEGEGISVAELTGEIPIISVPNGGHRYREESEDLAETGVEASPEESELSVESGSVEDGITPEDKQGKESDKAEETSESVNAQDKIKTADANKTSTPASGIVEPEKKEQPTAQSDPLVLDSGSVFATEVVGMAPVSVREPEMPAAVPFAEPGVIPNDLLNQEPLTLGEPQPVQRGHARQWAIMAAQVVIAAIAGALMFLGFKVLWEWNPIVAFVLSLLVIVGMVALIRVLRRTDDLISMLIAVAVGIFVTIGPLAVALSSH